MIIKLKSNKHASFLAVSDFSLGLAYFKHHANMGNYPISLQVNVSINQSIYLANCATA